MAQKKLSIRAQLLVALLQELRAETRVKGSDYEVAMCIVNGLSDRSSRDACGWQRKNLTSRRIEMYSYRRPMCLEDDVPPENSNRKKERMASGEEVEVTRYSDGSSTYHFGGPVGSARFNADGEEC